MAAYYREVENRDIDTFLVPDMDQIRLLLTEKEFQQKRAVKDEFDHMINWQRVFESIWMQIRWLRSFNQINELALKKILKKFMKNYFKIKDNTIKKKLEQIVESKEFNRKESQSNRDLRILTEGVLKFYADMFCNGSKVKSRKVLDAQHNKIRTIDAVTIALFLGGIIVMCAFFVFFVCIPNYDPDG